MDKTKLHRIFNVAVPDLIDDLVLMVLEYVGPILFVEKLLCIVKERLTPQVVPVDVDQEGVFGVYSLSDDKLVNVDIKTGAFVSDNRPWKRRCVRLGSLRDAWIRVIGSLSTDQQLHYQFEPGAVPPRIFRLDNGQCYRVMSSTRISKHVTMFHTYCITDDDVPGVDIHFASRNHDCLLIHGLYKAGPVYHILWSTFGSTFLSVARF